jgi:hypothetical protein
MTRRFIVAVVTFIAVTGALYALPEFVRPREEPIRSELLQRLGEKDLYRDPSERAAIAEKWRPSQKSGYDRINRTLGALRPPARILEEPIVFDPPQAGHGNHAFTAIPGGYTGDVLVENAANLKAARAAAPEALVILRRSIDPRPSLLQLREKPQDLTIVHDFPQTIEAAAAIHGQKVSKAQLDEILLARRELDETAARASNRVKHTDLAILAGPTSIAEQTKTILESNTEGHLIVLIGHIDGGSIRFHDKSVLPLIEIPRKGQVWVLGCRTIWDKLDAQGLDLATGRRIRYEDATAAVSAISQDIDKNANYHTIALHLQNLEMKPPAVLPSNGDMGVKDRSNSLPVDPNSAEPASVPCGFAVMVADNDVLMFKPIDQVA